MSQDAFSLLAEPIRRALWDMRWTELRSVQQQAIQILTQTDRDLLISARTAAGKTEAAFLPILSQICENPTSSVRVIYVGPLKALINDQFRRLEELCQHASIPVHRWHGDVSGQQKRNLLTRPGGVLLITPESIESLFVNQSTSLQSLFHSLSFIVIDELHALIGCERGTHLRSLLHRLERFTLASTRIVSLSATLGDMAMSAAWMRPGAPESVAILDDLDSQKAVKFRIHGYRRPNPNRGCGTIPQSDPDELSAAPPGEMTLDIFKSFRDTRNLVFANARADVEWFGDQLNQYAAKDGIPGRFLVHHGSLSRQIREHTELLMQSHAPYTTVCSATLELGIDIGNVNAVGQIGCPWSVGSLIQRLGRSGREDDQPHSMRMYILEDEPSSRSSLCDRLYPDLIRSIALSELMLEKWVEPPEIARFDFSTLTQQVLSVIAESGGLTARELFGRLVTNGAFRDIDQTMFASLLRSLGDHDLIEQMSSGDLILGLSGEQIVRHHEFYSAFATPPEYRVVYGGAGLGTLPVRYLPVPGDHILFAARRWQVISHDDRRKEIVVSPAKGRKRPKFQGASGTIHPKVRQTMREVLLKANPIAYLNNEAKIMLDEARQTAVDVGLHRGTIIPIGPSTSLWFTWTGTKSHRTLALIASDAGFECTDHEGLALEFNLSSTALTDVLCHLASRPIDPMALAGRQEPRQLRKYDQYVNDENLMITIANEFLDVEDAKRVLMQLTDQ